MYFINPKMGDYTIGKLPFSSLFFRCRPCLTVVYFQAFLADDHLGRAGSAHHQQVLFHQKGGRDTGLEQQVIHNTEIVCIVHLTLPLFLCALKNLILPSQGQPVPADVPDVPRQRSDRGAAGSVAHDHHGALQHRPHGTHGHQSPQPQRGGV